LCRTDLHILEGQWAAKSNVTLPYTQPADVAALADAGLTAYHAVRKALPLLYPGTTCVVIGAGGLGHIGIQCLAATTSTRIVVIDRNPAALALAKELGADATIVAGGDQVAEVLELTGGAGAEVVIDFVAEQGAEIEGPQMLRRAGSYFVIGYGGTVSIPTIDIISTEINVVGTSSARTTTSPSCWCWRKRARSRCTPRRIP
jgi:NAD+-dependent secondary alcohol dehydrogenase Adh1